MGALHFTPKVVGNEHPALKLSVPKTLRFENAETLRFLLRAPKQIAAIFSTIFGRFLQQSLR